MNRISAFFKRVFAPKIQPIKQDPKAKPEIEKVSRGGDKAPKRGHSNRSTASQRRRMWRNATTNPYEKRVVSFGTFRKMRLLPGQRTGMQKYQERVKA